MAYVGVDLGATNVRAVVGDGSATIIGSARTTTPSGPTGSAITEAVAAVVRDACSDAGLRPDSITAAGIGSMGRLDRAAGVVRTPSNLADDLGPIPLVEALSELLETERVFLCGDTAAGALGERFFNYPETPNVVYLTISSGIGGGIIADGSLLVGRNGNAGEVGHTTVDWQGALSCGCGRDGHWEAYCSGDNIPRFARLLYRRASISTDLPIEAESFTAKDVFEYAGEDELADRVLRRLATLNTVGVANVVHSYDPAVVIIGGAVALNNPSHVVAPIRDRLDDHVIVEAPAVALSELGEQAVLKGALVYALGDGAATEPPS